MNLGTYSFNRGFSTQVCKSLVKGEAVFKSFAPKRAARKVGDDTFPQMQKDCFEWFDFKHL
jgi:hypothetical protein